MKFNGNEPCPCGSKQKYKRCCKPYHDGLNAPNALMLMKSRYSAFVVHRYDYLVRTTHRTHDEYREDTKEWAKEIAAFCDDTVYISLTILDSEPGENVAYVTFKAQLSSGSFIERSRFVKEKEIWYYASGDIKTAEA